MEDNRKYSDKPLVGVGALIMRDDKILLIQRAYPPSVGRWSIPGGLVEIGESIWNACKREIAEETSLEIDLIGILDINEMIQRDKRGEIVYHYVLIGFLAKCNSEEVEIDSESMDWCWVTIDEALKKDLTATAARLMRAKKMGLTPIMKI